MLEANLTVEDLIKVLADPNRPAQDRLLSIGELKTEAMASEDFYAHSADYTVALRQAAEAEDMELKEVALESLCMAKDRPTQKRLIEGLQDRSKELVPPAQALRYLGYDVHAGVYPIARQYASDPPDDKTQFQALRLLGSDPDSVEIFATILGDKGEDMENRELASACLADLDLERYVRVATEIASDTGDAEEIRAAVLTELVSQETSPEDEALRAMAEMVKDDDGATTGMRACARTLYARTPGPPKDEEEGEGDGEEGNDEGEAEAEAAAEA